MSANPVGVGSSAQDSSRKVERRGLFAAAWAAVFAYVLKQTAAPVEAASSPVTYATDFMGSPVNSVSSSVYIEAAASFNSSPGNRVMTTRAYNPGVGGLFAASFNTYAVHGEINAQDFSVFPSVPNTSANTVAVEGINASSGTGGIGVSGVIPSSSTGNATAIYGLNYSKYAGPGPGAGGFGVYGLSAKGHGLVGATAASGAAAVVGATNGVSGAYAAAFYGPVIVGGDFTVVGGAKSAAVPHPDGSHRRLYCLESPESWFEDFGSGRLECGRADIAIDHDFAAVADLSDYHVFLTGYDTEAALQVKQRTPAGFRVEADARLAALKGLTDAELSATFSWRVVAKRKDIAGPRLERVTVPPEPRLPAVPDVSPATTAPAPRRFSTGGQEITRS